MFNQHFPSPKNIQNGCDNYLAQPGQQVHHLVLSGRHLRGPVPRADDGGGAGGGRVRQAPRHPLLPQQQHQRQEGGRVRLAK